MFKKIQLSNGVKVRGVKLRLSEYQDNRVSGIRRPIFWSSGILISFSLHPPLTPSPQGRGIFVGLG